ncbi:TPA: nuclear transport factor 2 family protein [Legionella pneumophila]|uniref:YybH family protein n=1 Tax=Legionella pneumophila TaxID=446 RepID=UPI0005C43113|nr:nuclear transport factor 2 family protein [Legionella pneumophila]GAN30643.1 snoaL-like domain protein [Legionella pneumophila]
MKSIANKENEVAIIHKLIEEYANAARDKDIDKIMSHYAPDIRSFDAVSQLQFKGAGDYRKHWQTCLSFCPGPTVFEVHQLETLVDNNLAVSYYLTYCGGTNEKGETQGGWMRGTMVHCKMNGKWKIMHEHYSIPFDMKTGNTLFDLKP